MSAPPAWFRLFLRILPRTFRDDHATEIVTLTQRYAEQRAGLGRASIWLRAAADIAIVGLSQRLRSGRSRRSGVAGHGAPGQARSLPAGILQDLRYGLRSLRREAAFTVFAALIVGVGIGGCITVFSVVQALLIEPLPFHEPDRLVWVSNGEWGRGQQLSNISVQVGHVVRLREHATELTDVAGYHLFDRDGDHTLAGTSGTDDPQRVTRLRVTENLFSVLGVEPALGRLFTTEEAWDNGPAAILLTHGFWQRRFAADPDVVGGTVVLDGAPASIIGVLPPAFDFDTIFAPGRRIDYVAPFPLSAQSDRRGNTLGLIGRLAPAATIESARAEAATIVAAGAATQRNGFDPIVRPLREHISGDFRPAMTALIGAVALVMLTVCANLSNLLLARGATRAHEMAIRGALGAGRARLVQQTMLESLLLAGSGAALGIVLAAGATRLLASRGLPIPLLGQVRIDGPALAGALAGAMLVGIILGLAPALRGAGAPLQAALKAGERGAEGRRTGSFRSALVVIEVALACLLLVVSMLMIRSFRNVLLVDLGYRAEGAVAMRIDPTERFASNDERAAFYSETLERVASLPGITAAGLSDILPMGFNRSWSAQRTDRPEAESTLAFVRVVSDGYLRAMGLALVAGRDFTPADDATRPPVALINETLAARIWPDEDPLGRTLESSGREYEVVGVVRGTRQRSAEQEPGPELFLSIRQLGDHAAVHLIMRGGGRPSELIGAARRELRSIDSGLPLDAVILLDDIVAGSVAPRRFLVTMLTGFAAFALLLASLGIYAVISYSVTRRHREIGIRMALGASATDVRRSVVRRTLALATLGLAIGLPASLAAGRMLESLLFGVTPLDAGTYAAVPAVLVLIAGAAGYLPARRVSEASPLDALAERAR